MGWLRTHTSANGTTTYTAYYRDLRGDIVTAGTYGSEREAEKAYQREEAQIAEGRYTDPRKGRIKFERYVTEKWQPHHVVEDTTRDNDLYRIPKYLTPWFGKAQMNEIMPSDVREWVTWMGADHGVKPATLHRVFNILSAIFTTAFNDRYTFLHPCKGVKLPKIPKKPLDVITPQQFEDLPAQITDDQMKLLVETDIETGMRWGELTDLRPCDWNGRTRVFTISRTVVEVVPANDPLGRRFVVKEYPKDVEYRKTKVSRHLGEKIDAHIATKQLSDNDLLFEFVPPPAKSLELPDPETMGFTKPNEHGRRYRHGTLTAYNAGKCRLECCRTAYRIYRAKRRSAGKDNHDWARLETRTVNTDGHIPNSWFHWHVWGPARRAAKLGRKVRPYDLRHAYASWLLESGATLQEVKELLGHASITTTQNYLHSMSDPSDGAVEALAEYRSRQLTSAETVRRDGLPPAKDGDEGLEPLSSVQAELAEMKLLLQKLHQSST